MHEITRTDTHLQGLWAGKDGEKACHKDHAYPYHEPIRSGTDILLEITELDAKFLNCRYH